ncbi:MAG: VWA domain-containing protein [Candidatus Eisenbacteria bacterium]
MRWLWPALLGLLPLLVALAWWRQRSDLGKPATLGFSTADFLPARAKDRTRLVLHVLAGAGMLLLTLALARPQKGFRENELSGRGVDIVIALDVSSSMRAEDFQPDNRLAVAKTVAQSFVASRPRDRLGLVIFAGTAVTQCPLTLDHAVLGDLLGRVNFGMVEDGTAIGSGLATALNRLRNSTAKSKVVILLTDGDNNRGAIDPATAAELARALGVRVYTIGVGTSGIAPTPIDDPVFGLRYELVPVRIDEGTLKVIAARTGGRYFRAKDPAGLVEVYRQIDRLEKTDVTSASYSEWRDHGPALLLVASLCLALAFALSLGPWARVP